MRHNKRIILILSVLWIALLALLGLELDATPVSFLVSAADGTEEEVIAYESQGEYYVFLPSHTAQVRVHMKADLAVSIHGRQLEDGMSCGEFPEQIPLEFRCDARNLHSSITFVRSANVASLFLRVPADGLEYVHKTKGNEISGESRIYAADGSLHYNGDLQLNGRGNSTWELEKKPYSITLSTAADLLGMGSAQKWILLSNGFDLSNLRNTIATGLSSDLGLPYTPQSQWIDLYVNGEYRGLYLLSERNEIHPERVNLDAGSSFLVAMEQEERLLAQDYPYLRTTFSNALRIHHCGISNEELAWIWETAEHAIFSQDGIDPVTGKHWTQLIDLDSWAKKYLLDEVLGNYDGGALSQYFHYEASDGKIYAGPLWDMDNILGISNWTGFPNAIQAGREHLWNDADHPYYFALLQKEEFRSRVLELYQEEFLPLLDQLLETQLPRYEAQVAQASAMNRLRWPDPIFSYEVADIRTYLAERTAFLQAYWFDQEEFITVRAILPWRVWTHLEVRPGETMQWLENFRSEATNWYVWGTNEPYDITAPVYQDITIYGVMAETE